MFDSDMLPAPPHALTGRTDLWADSLLKDHAFLRLVWRNFHTVEPGRLYRSNHPLPWQLARTARRYGLKTVINLRGKRNCGSDRLSREAVRQLGLVQFDHKLESRGAPTAEGIQGLADIYRSMAYPALIHCKAGADRAGLAAALYIILHGGDSMAALRQLNWRYLHFPRSHTGILDAFFLRYRAEAEGRLPFLDWVHTEYDPAKLHADFRANGLSAFFVDRILHRE